MDFENGFGVSVLFGDVWYSDGITTYEVGIVRHGNLCYNTSINPDGDAVLGYRTKEEVTEIMRKVQEFPADIVFEKDYDEDDENEENDEKEEEVCDSFVESCESEEPGTRTYILDLEILIAEEIDRKLEQRESRVKNAFLRAKAYGLIPNTFVGIAPTDSYAGIMLRDEKKSDVQIMYLPTHLNKLDALQATAKELMERIRKYNKIE